MDWSLVLQEWKLLPEVFLRLVSNPMLMMTLALGGITGMIAGMLPGISAVMSMSLLLGFVFRVPAEIGLGLLIAIYVGAMAAGGVTATIADEADMLRGLGTNGRRARWGRCVSDRPLALSGRPARRYDASRGGSRRSRAGVTMESVGVPCGRMPRRTRPGPIEIPIPSRW